MAFQLLGPVQAWIGGRPVRLGVRKQRFVLAVLALEVNRLVTTDRLIALIWPDGPPRTARAVVYTHVSRLRAALTEARASDHGVMVRSDGAGYVLLCDPALVDAHRFRSLLAEAGGRDGEARVALLDEALALWRGPALAGTAPEATRLRLGRHLEEARLTALEDRFDALLELERHHGVVDELSMLVAEHPLRHRFAAQLMRALHASGRTAEALATYRRVRQLLAGEFGLDPPPELRRLEVAILREEPAVTRSALVGRPRPAQLPADLRTFTGRTGELAELLARDRCGIWAIDGMAGVGKTALAIHLAHRLRASFPDGQLFVDLHGHTSGLGVIQPADALDGMLRALGVPGGQIPLGADDRAALLRSRLADRRVLLVLDNAADEAQVRPLLPGSADCLVLITSRRSLTGLDDVHPVPLDVLPLDDAFALFDRVAGRAGDTVANRTADKTDRADKTDAAQVVELCGRLPLAIRIAAARLRARPSWTTGHLAERLRDERHRLAELAIGQRSVASAFRLSYDQLDDRRQHLFRVLGLHPGADLDSYAAAALAGTTASEASRDLEELVDEHLLQQRGPGRYAFHDLIRACAIERVTEEEPDLRAPLRRLLDHYRHSAAVAMDVFAPHERRRRPHVPNGPVARPAPTDAAAAAAWMDDELSNLVAVARHAAVHGWPRHTCDLSATLFRFLDTRGHYLVATELHGLARDSATDPVARGRALNDLAVASQRLGRHPAAIEHYRQAVELYRDAGAVEGEAGALHNLGHALLRTGKFTEATDHCQQALAMFRAVGDQNGQAHTLRTLGSTCQYLGKYVEALEYDEQALVLHAGAGNRLSEAHVLNSMGVLNWQLGRRAEALEHHRRAAALFHTVGDPAEALALGGMGGVLLDMGHHAEAIEYCRRALELSRANDDRNAEFEARCHLGEALRVCGSPGEALDQLRTALDLAGALDQPHDVARAHDRLAHVHDDLGERDLAGEHWQQALAIFTELGAPEADQVQASLRGADASGLPRTRA